MAGFARSVARRAAAGQRGDKTLGRGAPALLILAAARRGVCDWSAADAHIPASPIRFFQERADAPAMTTPLSLRAHGVGTQTHAEASKIQEDGCDGRGDDIAMVKLMDFDEEAGVLGCWQDKALHRR